MKILIVYYSMYGHVLKLARAAAEGAQTVAGAEVVLRRVQELDSNLSKLQGSKHAQAVLAQQQDIRIATVEDLAGGRCRHLRHPHPLRQHVRPDEAVHRRHW